MHGNDEYRSKLISLQEAVAKVQSDQTIGIGIAASEPVGLIEELARQADRLFDITTWTCLPMRPYEIFLNPEMEGHFFNENWFYGAPDRKVHSEGRVSYTPNNLHMASTDKLKGHGGKLDFMFGTATPPNAEGYLSLSLGAVAERFVIIDDGRSVHSGLMRDLVLNEELVQQYLGASIQPRAKEAK